LGNFTERKLWPSVAARVFQSPFSRVFFLSSQEKRNDERNSCLLSRVFFFCLHKRREMMREIHVGVVLLMMMGLLWILNPHFKILLGGNYLSAYK